MSAPQPVRRAASGAELLAAVKGRFGTVLADPPWRFSNRTGKMAPEHRRLSRYRTMTLKEIAALPVARLVAEQSHLYLWVPNALLAQGLEVLESWGFTYKTNIVWFKVRKDVGPDGRGVGFYFRKVTELVLFGVRGQMRTLPAGRRQTSIITNRMREHSRKPMNSMTSSRHALRSPTWSCSRGGVGRAGCNGATRMSKRPPSPVFGVPAAGASS
jgi:N6-adenosine-specific RNA methylase IME4